MVRLFKFLTSKALVFTTHVSRVLLYFISIAKRKEYRVQSTPEREHGSHSHLDFGAKGAALSVHKFALLSLPTAHNYFCRTGRVPEEQATCVAAFRQKTAFVAKPVMLLEL